MSLSVSTLYNDLLGIFERMNGLRNEDGNAYFAREVSRACADYTMTGTINTNDAGDIPKGVFTGTGVGHITVQPAICYNVIYPACVYLGSASDVDGNRYLATKIAQGIQDMTDAGVVSTNVSGTAIHKQTGVPQPVVGTGVGTLSCNSVPLFQELYDCFTKMNFITDGNGNSYFADRFSKAVDSYLKAGVVNTTDKDDTIGAFGVGAMS